LALESAGTGIVSSLSQPVPVSPSQNQSKTASLGGFETGTVGDGDGDGELLAALAALQRIGISRERARVFGFRFRNEDWARAARLIRETDE
jgi:hypothetical protein